MFLYNQHKQQEYCYELFPQNSEKGYNFPFILLGPRDMFKRDKVKIYVEGPNSVDYEKNGQQSLEQQIKYHTEHAQQSCEPADGTNFNTPYVHQIINQPIIIPIIERVDNEHKNGEAFEEFYTQHLGRNVMLEKSGKFERLDLQVLAMINQVKKQFEKRNVKVEEKSGIFGLSTAGAFATRLSFLQPQAFDTVISGCQAGLMPVPYSDINGKKAIYPLGTADYEEITSKPFNEEEYKKMKQLWFVGESESEFFNLNDRTRLNSKEIINLANNIYGECTLQERMKQVKQIVSTQQNIECEVLPLGHQWQGKGNAVSKYIKNSQPVMEKPKILPRI